MLFVGLPGNQPLNSQQVAALMRGVRAAEIDDLVRDLNQQYAATNCPYQVVGDAAGYRMTLRPEFDAMRERFLGRVRQARLSPAAIEVLAAVAYNEPLTGDEVSKLRGTPSGHILSHLVRRQLLRIERSDQQPRINRYFTTRRFLDMFGLASLEELPRGQDLDKL
jgi:segregation and condensation protein B